MLPSSETGFSLFSARLQFCPNEKQQVLVPQQTLFTRKYLIASASSSPPHFCNIWYKVTNFGHGTVNIYTANLKCKQAYRLQ